MRGSADTPATGPEVGIVCWFEIGDERQVARDLALVDELGVRRLRTGFSWADYERGDMDGPGWFDYLVHDALGERIRSGQLDVLFNFLYTPSRHARPKKKTGERTTASPPRPLRAYGRFVSRTIERYGPLIADVELLNEPDIPAEWDRELDWQWHKLARTLRCAGRTAQRHRRRVVLGGPTRTEPILYERLAGSRWLRRDALRHVDVVGLHGFPGTWDTSVTHASDWRFRGWRAEVTMLRETCRRLGCPVPVWITETGSSTYGDPSGASQLAAFRATYDELSALGVERLYWYSLTDMADDRPTINNVITGESRADNPHSHHLGMKRPLLDHLKSNRERFFGERGNVGSGGWRRRSSSSSAPGAAVRSG